MKYLIYSDGATSNNGKENAIGGWAAVILDYNNFENRNADTIVVKGFENGTTNQRMELTAALQGLENLKLSPFDEVILRTDSAYLYNCYKQKWYENWQRNGWKNSKKETVANQDLWEGLIPFFNNINISIEKVKGHNGDYWNEIVDKLAVEAKNRP